MRRTAISRVKRLAWQSLGSALWLIFTGCSEPAHVVWNNEQPMVEPEVPPPQGVLAVYSERYVIEDSGVPVIYRRPVEVYNDEGKLVASERNPMGDGPIRFDLSPGHYLVASESQMQWRRVQVDVQDGRQTVVPESLLAKAPLFSSQPERFAPMVAHSAVSGGKR